MECREEDAEYRHNRELSIAVFIMKKPFFRSRCRYSSCSSLNFVVAVRKRDFNPVILTDKILASDWLILVCGARMQSNGGKQFTGINPTGADQMEIQ